MKKSWIQKWNIVILIAFILLVPFLYQTRSLFTKELKIGDVMDRTYYAPQDVKYVDKVATEQARKEKEATVPLVLRKDEQVEQDLLKEIKEYFDGIRDYKTKAETIDAQEKTLSGKQDMIDALENQKEDILEHINNPFGLKPAENQSIASMKVDDIQRLQEMFERELRRMYDGNISDKDVAQKQSELVNNGNFYYFFPDETVSPLLQHISLSMKANVVVDETATKAAKAAARSSVEDIYKVFKKSEKIIEKGVRIDESEYQKIQALGLNKRFASDIWVRYVPFVSLLAVLLYACIYLYSSSIFMKIRHFGFLFVSIAVVVGVHQFMKDTIFSFLSFVPALTLLYLMHIFWKRNVMLFVSLFLSIFLCLGDGSSLSVMVVASMYLFATFPKRFKVQDLILSSIYLGTVLFVADCVFYFASEGDLEWENSFPYIPSAVVASLFAIGLIPLLEKTLNMATSIRLYELTDDNHPLLVSLRLRAHGTHTHSVMVRTLCEIAGNAIGTVDKLLLRVAADFHDVGKLKHPHLFAENTQGHNPHDDMTAFESSRVIRSHVQDGLDLCKKYKLPTQIIDLIASHHGDALLFQFYEQAKKEDPDMPEASFRYPHPKPRTKEQGILLLADSVEAYSRRLMRKPKDEILSSIESFMYEKIRHGILSDCELTIAELETIKEAFLHHYESFIHERVPYPSEKKE